MDIEIVHGPGNAAAKLRLQPGETCTAEAGAMIAMSSDIHVETTTHKRQQGGLFKAVKRMLAGESFFINHFTAGSNGGEVMVAATLAGDMMPYDLQNENLIVQAGSYVACEEHVNIDLGWQGFKTLLSGENLFWLHLNGTGKVVLSSFGAIYPIQVDGEYIVDTGHIVAFNETLKFSITKAGKSWLSSYLGGEGFVCKFKGKGTVWCQSHNTKSFGAELGAQLKPR
jgi:uncharacterized protein (TIGR00266 family)